MKVFWDAHKQNIFFIHKGQDDLDAPTFDSWVINSICLISLYILSFKFCYTLSGSYYGIIIACISLILSIAKIKRLCSNNICNGKHCSNGCGMDVNGIRSCVMGSIWFQLVTLGCRPSVCLFVAIFSLGSFCVPLQFVLAYLFSKSLCCPLICSQP